jgi:hypothetical protein
MTALDQSTPTLITADEARRVLEVHTSGVRRFAQTIVVQAEQIVAVLALHEHWVANAECKNDGYPWPCPTARALGVTE